MHRKRRVIQSALRDTKQDEMESKRLIRKIISLEQELKLVGRERRLKRIDHEFLKWEQPSVQSNWSIDTSKVPIVPSSSKVKDDLDHEWEELSDQLRLDLVAQRDLDAYFDRLFKTNFELIRKLDEIKEAQHIMHTRFLAMQQIFVQLEQELAIRNRFIAKLSESHVTTRTQAIMDGTPVFLNSQKHWVLPGYLLPPKTLTDAELQGLRRAESFLMEKDELHWKFLLRAQLEYDSATLIQSVWHGALKKATKCCYIDSRNYFRYLFTRATSLPRWCRPGREVIVAPSIAQKCAISFQFYPKRDFPAGDYRREPKGTSISELMEIARQDEMSTLKDKLTADDGLYVKLFPNKDEKVINSAIVVEVPVDRFGLVRVVLDGIAIPELVPVAKLTDRWKRIRVKRVKSKERRKTRAIVFARNPDTTYERIESDEEEVEESLEKEWRRQRRRKRNENNVDDDNPDYIFEDLVTGRIMRRGHPNNTHEDPVIRARVIATRKKEYEYEKQSQFRAKQLACAVKIQCAWRSKRAREHFQQILVLRAKERERECLVDQIGAANAHKRQSKPSKTKRGGLFSRFRRS
ncbi:IQ motif, EF-hand binding site [Phytophthora cactorum]|nr:IQ motif, EF-hand binding site [Phytophthora cactorum]